MTPDDLYEVTEMNRGLRQILTEDSDDESDETAEALKDGVGVIKKEINRCYREHKKRTHPAGDKKGGEGGSG